ncbi:MAG: hypothetical protein IJM56_08805 [Clostridia bacterium]|nr:hypothetical protein [Clostridia bacterium]
MRNRIAAFLLVLALSCCVCAQAVLAIKPPKKPQQTKPPVVHESIEEYAFRIFDEGEERFKMDYTVEPVTDGEDAAKKAEPFFEEIYGDNFRNNDGMLYETYYRPERDLWLIIGRPQFNTPPDVIVLHGEFYCFIEGATGRVLFIFATK